MPIPRVYADFQNLDDENRLRLTCVGTKEDLARQTSGVECRKDVGVLDEIPGAYKSIEAVMKNQKDLVKIVAEIKQVVCVKG